MEGSLLWNPFLLPRKGRDQGGIVQYHESLDGQNAMALGIIKQAWLVLKPYMFYTYITTKY